MTYTINGIHMDVREASEVISKYIKDLYIAMSAHCNSEQWSCYAVGDIYGNITLYGPLYGCLIPYTNDGAHKIMCMAGSDYTCLELSPCTDNLDICEEADEISDILTIMQTLAVYRDWIDAKNAK